MLHRNAWIGWGDVTKNNIIHPSFDEQSVAEMGREYAASGEMRDLVIIKCIEVMLSEEPKSVAIKKGRKRC